MDNKHSKLNKLLKTYKVIIRSNDSFQQKSTFNINIPAILLILLCNFIIIFVLSLFIIGNTELNSLIPSSTCRKLSKNLEQLQIRSDSLNKIIEINNKYYNNIQKILSDAEVINYSDNGPITTGTNFAISDVKQNFLEDQFTNINNSTFSLDSFTNIQDGSQPVDFNTINDINNLTFYPPIKGVISSDISTVDQHYGTDIIPLKSEVVKATLNGVVIFSGWTLETGNVVIISHLNNLISIYKHNSAVLKKENDYVTAGEPIAIAGNSGELTSGPHLHFELWYKNRPVNAREYIAF